MIEEWWRVLSLFLIEIVWWFLFQPEQWSGVYKVQLSELISIEIMENLLILEKCFTYLLAKYKQNIKIQEREHHNPTATYWGGVQKGEDKRNGRQN